MDYSNMRNLFDLSHYSFRIGSIGRLQVKSIIPIVAGDSMSLYMHSIFRLSALRRYMSVDAQIDNFAFYIPYRHIYGDDWKTFIQSGHDESVTFSTHTFTSIQHYLPYVQQSASCPLWLIAGYNRIWNRYFRMPTDTASLLSDTDEIADGTDPVGTRTGRLIGRLKTPWTTPNLGTEVTDDDKKIPLKGTNPNEYIDLLDIDLIKSQYKTEIERDWFNTRYSDIIDNTWGGRVNIDADERPELIMRESHPLSGYDVDGTAGSEFGSFTGKAMSNPEFKFNRRYFPEHGTLWIMSTVRFPTIHIQETHPLVQTPNPDYQFFAADPELSCHVPPAELDISEWLVGQSNGGTYGEIPFGQHYRFQPNVVDLDMSQLQGFPWLDNSGNVQNNLIYHQIGDYDNVFQSTQLQHWQAQSRIAVSVSRKFPTAQQSIFAGTHKNK